MNDEPSQLDEFKQAARDFDDDPERIKKRLKEAMGHVPVEKPE